MVGNVGSTSNLVNMISLSYQQNSTGAQGMQSPPPPPPGEGGADPLGAFDTVDTDTDGSISESEYDILTQGVLAVTGSELSGSFLDFDTDGDGALNASELRSVLDEAGFAPPPPPPQQVASAYENQSGDITASLPSDDALMTQLLEYIENQPGRFDITA